MVSVDVELIVSGISFDASVVKSRKVVLAHYVCHVKAKSSRGSTSVSARA